MSTESRNGAPLAIYVWLVPSEQVQEQPGSWRIRKWDTEPFPEANYTLPAVSETGGSEAVECCAQIMKALEESHATAIVSTPPKRMFQQADERVVKRVYELAKLGAGK